MTTRTLRSFTSEELTGELARRQAEKLGLPKSRPFCNTDWQNVHVIVIEGVRREAEQGFRDENLRAYVYEAAIETVFGKGFWEWSKRRFP